MQPCTTTKTLATDRPVRCRYVTNYHVVWDRILPGLLALQARGVHDWTIRGVEEMLREGRAFIVIDEDEPRAFAILCVDTFGNDLSLLVFAVWHPSGDASERFQPQLERIARTAGANYMHFYSQRPGMVRLAKRLGYHMHAIKYVKELT